MWAWTMGGCDNIRGTLKSHTARMAKMTEEEVQQQKDIQFYAAAMSAWVNTSLEHDKSLLTLAAGGIALLVTLLSTNGVHNIVLLVLHIATMLSFLACLVAVIGVFRRNGTHIKHVLANRGDPDPLLRAFDNVARASFSIGAVLLTIIGISTAALSYTEREARMSNERITREAIAELGRSLNGIGTLRPSTSAPAQAPASAPAQQQGGASSGTTGSKGSTGR
jgi:hypothetical protein